MQPLVPPTPLFFLSFFPIVCMPSFGQSHASLPIIRRSSTIHGMFCRAKTAQTKEKKGFERASVALLFAFGPWLGRFILSLHATIPTGCCCFSSTCLISARFSLASIPSSHEELTSLATFQGPFSFPANLLAGQLVPHAPTLSLLPCPVSFMSGHLVGSLRIEYPGRSAVVLGGCVAKRRACSSHMG